MQIHMWQQFKKKSIDYGENKGKGTWRGWEGGKGRRKWYNYILIL